MRVAVFSEVYWPMVSGVGHTLTHLADALRGRGHAVRVYTASYALPPGAVERPEVHRSPGVPLPLYPDVQWAAPRFHEIVADLAAFGPDLVHVATEFAMGLAGQRASQRLGVPLVASAHTDYEQYATRYGVPWAVPLGWRYLRWFYRRAGAVLCPTGIFQAHLRRRGVPHARVWSRGVDAQRFHPQHRTEAFRKQLGLGPADPLVLYVGRLAPEKGLDVLVEGWRRLGRRRGRARLALVGEGPLRDALRREAPAGVHLAGLLRGHELAEAYASADLFACPSRTETFGNVLLEAMASGLPCIAAAAGGQLEFCRHDDTAWLVPPDDPGALAGALMRLLDDTALRARLARRGLALARGRTWDAVFDQLEVEYRTALDLDRRRQAA